MKPLQFEKTIVYIEERNYIRELFAGYLRTSRDIKVFDFVNIIAWQMAELPETPKTLFLVNPYGMTDAESYGLIELLSKKGMGVAVLSDKADRGGPRIRMESIAKGYISASDHTLSDVASDIESILDGSATRQKVKKTKLRGWCLAAIEGTTPMMPHLTKRELQIADQLKKGLLNKEIGRNLDISDRTVEVHVGNIYKKLSVNTRLKAVGLLNSFSAPAQGATEDKTTLNIKDNETATSKPDVMPGRESIDNPRLSILARAEQG